MATSTTAREIAYEVRRQIELGELGPFGKLTGAQSMRLLAYQFIISTRRQPDHPSRFLRRISEQQYKDDARLSVEVAEILLEPALSDEAYKG